MPRHKEFPYNPGYTISKVIRDYGIKGISQDRKDLCTAGIELCVLNKDDILYILRDAVSLHAAERRLRSCISNFSYH